jgi:hypothetical protein
MDISYQKDAFAALSERHKKAMFQNAKLKDEVALQGVGLNNLGSRLGKQNQQYDVCTKQLRALNKRVSRVEFGARFVVTLTATMRWSRFLLQSLRCTLAAFPGKHAPQLLSPRADVTSIVCPLLIVSVLSCGS